MSFKYKVLKKAVSYDLANFCFNYLKLKRDAVYFMYKTNIVNENPFLGTWNDSQFINTYSCYADFVMETLLLKLLPTVEKETKLKLIPTYSYTRLYKKGDELKKHKDRPSCEVSITLNLGGDNWDIYLEPSGKTNQKGIAVSLKVGDMLIYKGCELEHWREAFKGDICGQVFLHYNNINGEFKDQNKYDGRSILGIQKTGAPNNIR
tara:strand:+ start:1138 stop:1755 length:618 start_codon:yes stop_codon:yes gene_type:complete